MKAATITLDQLVAAKACSSGAASFSSRFGSSIILTEANAVELAQGFDWEVICDLMSARTRFAYGRITARARRGLIQRHFDLLQDYRLGNIATLDDCQRLRNAANADFTRTFAPVAARLYIEQVSA